MGSETNLYAIDLSYAQRAQPDDIDLTDVERHALELTVCRDRDTQFEPTDLTFRKRCWKRLEGVEKEEITPAHFREWRCQIIKAILERQSEPLLERWPNIDLDILAQIIDKSTKGVSDIASVIPKLISAMLAHDLNEKGAYLVALVWNNVYSLKMNHQRWISTGNRPLLPENGFETYIDRALHRIETAQLTVGLLNNRFVFNDDSSEFFYMVARYSPANERIDFPIDYFIDPLFPFSEKALLPINIILGHELYHDYQYFRDGGEARLMDCEYEAEVLGAKIFIMMTGFEKARLEDYRRDADDDDSLSEGIYQNFIDSQQAQTPMSVFFETYSEFFLWDDRPLTFQIAMDELLLGEAEIETKEKAKYYYTVGRVLTLLYEILQHVVSNYEVDKRSMDEEAFQALIDRTWRDVEDSIPELEQASIESLDDALLFAQNLLTIYVLMYYREGAEQAYDYFEKHALPLLIEKIVPCFTEHLTFDYVIEQSHKTLPY